MKRRTWFKMDNAGAKSYLTDAAARVINEMLDKNKPPSPIVIAIAPTGDVVDLCPGDWDPEVAVEGVSWAYSKGAEAIITQGFGLLNTDWRSKYTSSEALTIPDVFEPGDYITKTGQYPNGREFGLCFVMATRDLSYSMIVPFLHKGNGAFRLGRVEDREIEPGENQRNHWAPRSDDPDIDWVVLSEEVKQNQASN